MGGVYYLNIDNTSQNGLKFPVNSVVPGPVRPPGFRSGSDADLKTNSYSLFGQLEYDLTDTLTLITGARYIIEKTRTTSSPRASTTTTDSRAVHQGPRIDIGPTVGGAPTATTDTGSDNLWTGKLQLDWQPNEDWLVYRRREPRREGRQLQRPARRRHCAVARSVVIPYDEEVLLVLRDRLQVHLDGRPHPPQRFGLLLRLQDYQAFLFTGVGGVVINADAETIGAELEIQTSPIDGLDIMLAASWFDAEVKDVPLRVDRPVVHGRRADLRAGGPGRRPDPLRVGDVRRPRCRCRATSATRIPSTTTCATSMPTSSTATRCSTRGSAGRPIDDVWTIALDVRNLGDEKAGIHGYDLATLCGCNEVSYRPPRWYGVNLKYAF